MTISSFTISGPTTSASYGLHQIHRGAPKFKTYRDKVVGNHKTHSPTFICRTLSDLSKELFFDFCWLQFLGDGNQVLHSEQSHRVLVIASKFSVNGECVRQYLFFRKSVGKILKKTSNGVCERCIYIRTPRAFAAARRTIGVSSEAKSAKPFRISSFLTVEAFE